ncbi:hypothetical protein [Mycoplasma miroungirhinis]|uniref:Uncharacterized protein n=1 Tax=Mycoplasma miroungirhinis TaxID=754516 RepID=A0A6M4JAV3_9MOLU|nr:hypothetical protein [Mycoplasma miroungirhinis]QJR44103.1 hypothetical protein HLA92_01475 [Mycoplasma miroungirhinis]
MKLDSDFTNVNNLEETINLILENIKENNNKMLDDLQFTSQDWHFIMFGTTKQGFESSHIAKVFSSPEYRSKIKTLGRRWLLFGGWEILFATDRYKNKLSHDMDQTLANTTLNDQQKTKIKNYAQDIFSLYSQMVDTSQKNIKNLSQTKLLSYMDEAKK